MTTLNDILSAHDRTNFATSRGTQTHARLQNIVIDGANTRGDFELIQQIKSRPELLPFFTSTAGTEVPIAGTINNRFISRRIDRLVIDDTTKTIKILDYKTDANRAIFCDKYMIQLREYAHLLRAIYPGYKISAYILWTHDFSLEKVPVMSL